MPSVRGSITVGVLVTAALGVLAATSACGTDPVGVESCQKIEKVRCESAPACGIALSRPLHAGNSAKSDVAACTRYYEDACLHGMALAKDPGPQVVDACVNAIISGDCTVVKAPETHPACAFLAPASAADAGSSDAAASADAAHD